MEQQNCRVCRKVFETYRSEKRPYCSRECFNQDHRRIAKCPVCGKEKILEKRKPQKDYCSLKCWGIAHQSISVTTKCLQCGKESTTRPSQEKKYCSKKCFDDSRRLPEEEFKKRWYERVKEYRKKNPDKTAVWKQNRRAREANCEGSFTEQEWAELKEKHNQKCAHCKEKEKLTVDHIIPISRGGTNYIGNIQPLCLVCNSKKWIKT